MLQFLIWKLYLSILHNRMTLPEHNALSYCYYAIALCQHPYGILLSCLELYIHHVTFWQNMIQNFPSKKL